MSRVRDEDIGVATVPLSADPGRIRGFAPQFMKVGILTAALQELTPRAVRDRDPDRAVIDWLQFGADLGADTIQLSAALHPSETDVRPEAINAGLGGATTGVGGATPDTGIRSGS